MIVQSINLHQFRDAFKAHERTNFSYEGLGILFEALEDLSENNGSPFKLDVIALCCDFVEMSEQSIKEYYPGALDYDDVEDFLSDNTWLCGRTEQNTLVFQQF